MAKKKLPSAFLPRTGGMNLDPFGMLGNIGGQSTTRNPKSDKTTPLGVEIGSNGGLSGSRNPSDGNYNLFGQNNNKVSYDDILGRITNDGKSNNDLLSLLNALGVDNNDNMDGKQEQDWNKQLLDTLINYLLELEKRKYNEGTRDEQRLYDSPTNQLVRLMAAGVPRDAAIQMLSEGSDPIQTEGAAAAEGIAPSQSSLNRMQQILAPIQTATQAIGTVGNLVSLGFSLPQAILQTNLLRAQNFLSQQQVAAFQGVNAVTNAIQTALDAGILSHDDVDGWSNANDVQRWMSDHTDTNLVKPLAQSGAITSAFGSTIGREMFNSYWRQMRDSRDAGTVWDEYVTQQRLQTFRQNMDIKKLSSEIANIDADTMFKDAETQEVFARICLVDAQTEGQELTNGNLRFQFELNEAGFPMLKDVYLQELQDQVLKWSLLDDPDIRAKRMNRWLREEDNMYSAAWLETLRQRSVGNFRSNHPILMELVDAFAGTGGSQTIKDLSDTAGSAIEGLWNGAKALAKFFK